MTGRMVRTQIYLPPDVHKKLKTRAERDGLTLGLQIRTALEEYFNRLDIAEEGVLRADDPIFRFIGIDSGGTSDAALEHDHYLYGWPKRRSSRTGTRRQGYSSPSRRERTGNRRRS